MAEDGEFIELLRLVSRLIFPMPLMLGVAKFLEHADLAIGCHERFAALRHLGRHRLPLLIGRFAFDLEDHFISRRFGEPIDVHGSRARSIERMALQLDEFALDLGDTLENQLLRLLGFRELPATLVAPRLAKPQQGGQSKPKDRHFLGNLSAHLPRSCKRSLT
jgi:hypothetical protein